MTTVVEAAAAVTVADDKAVLELATESVADDSADVADDRTDCAVEAVTPAASAASYIVEALEFSVVAVDNRLASEVVAALTLSEAVLAAVLAALAVLCAEEICELMLAYEPSSMPGPEPAAVAWPAARAAISVSADAPTARVRMRGLWDLRV